MSSSSPDNPTWKDTASSLPIRSATAAKARWSLWRREDFDRYFATFAKPQVEELLAKYRPDLLWFDEIDMKTDAQV